jgi:hypothetical protein
LTDLDCRNSFVAPFQLPARSLSHLSYVKTPRADFAGDQSIAMAGIMGKKS